MMLAHALRHAALGYHVFPCEPGGKRPYRNERWPNGIRWSKAATDDLDRVRHFWTQWPGANVGIAAKPSGLFVVDCDKPKEEVDLGVYDYLGQNLNWQDIDGELIYDEAIERYGGSRQTAYDTYQVITPRGGRHFYYRWPDDVHASQASILPGLLDVRGNGGNAGGYVLGAGSVVGAGAYEVVNDAPVRHAPRWLVRLCTERPKSRPADTRRSAPLDEWAREQSFAGLVGAVQGAMEGNRNASLLWAARCMCSDGASLDECLRTLGPAAQSAGLPEREVTGTIRSAYRLQGQKQ